MSHAIDWLLAVICLWVVLVFIVTLVLTRK